MRSLNKPSVRRTGVLCLVLSVAACAQAQVASSLLNEDTIFTPDPNFVVSAISSSDTNGIGGWATSITINDPNNSLTLTAAYGTVDGVAAPDLLRAEGFFAGFTQSSWEFTIGLSDLGEIGYSATLSDAPVTSADSVWLDDTPFWLEGTDIVGGRFDGLFEGFGSAPQVTNNGELWWVAGVSTSAGGSSANRALISSVDGILLAGGALIPGLPVPLDDGDSPSFDFRVSSNGANYIVEYNLEDGIGGDDVTTANDGVVFVNGVPLVVDGVILREGNIVPVGVGGIGDDWDNFDFLQINDFGEYLVTGDTDGSTATDEFVLVDDVIALREGDAIGDPNNASIVDGSIEAAWMNQQGDWVVIWDVDSPITGSNEEALIVNGELVLVEDVDAVDFDGDGIVDPTKVVGDTSAFMGSRSLRISDRDPNGVATVYFTADVVDIGSTAEVEGFYALPIALGTGTANDLELSVSDSPDPLFDLPGAITYDIAVRNNGTSPLSGVTTTTTLPMNVTLDPNSLPAGAVFDPNAGTVTIAFGALDGFAIATSSFFVTASTAGDRTATTVATLNENDPDLSNNTVVSVTDVGRVTDLAVNIADTPDPLADPNGVITYTVTVENFGPSDATGVMAMLALDPNTVFESSTAGVHDGSPVGGVVSVDIGALTFGGASSFDVVVSPVVQGVFTATADVTGAQSDPDTGNNTATEETTFSVDADLVVTGSDAPDPVTPVGGQITYTIDYSNDGPSPAENVTLTVTLADGVSFFSTDMGAHDGAPNGGVVTVPLGALGSGASGTVTIVVDTLEAGRQVTDVTIGNVGLAGDPAPLSNSGPIATQVYDVAPAGLPVAIFSDIVTDPSSDVPGLVGVKFSSFDRPSLSPDTALWITTADTDASSSMDEVILTGRGRCDLMVAAQEGVSTLDPGDQIGFIDSDVTINDNGGFAFATNTNGTTSADEVIVVWDPNAAMFVTIAREGNLAAPVAADYGSSLDAAAILNNGQVWFVGDTTLPDTNTDEVVFSKNGNTAEAQEGVTIPGGQTGSETWDGFDTDLSVDANGLNWAVQGDLSGDTSTDDVFAVNGDVVIQETVVIPGSGFTSGANEVDFGRMLANGEWYARGDNEDGQDWVVTNGSVLAKTGDAVAAGSSELYSDAPFSSTFFAYAENNVGDYIVAATTSALDDVSNAVLVLNGTTVVVREDDLVDINGDGLANDDARINTFGNDDILLTDDLQLYTNVTLRSEDRTTTVGDAWLVINLCGVFNPVFGDIDRSGVVDFDDYLVLEAAIGVTDVCDPNYSPCADLNGDGKVDLLDAAIFQVLFG